MFDSIKYLIQLAISRLENNSQPESMEEKIKRWRSYGIKIGSDCMIYTELYDRRDSFLLEIGNNVTMSGNVQLMMHDNAVIKFTQGKYTDYLGRIKIGDNCFIGMGATILPGVTIADNCIIGAGSVVTKSITKPHSVYSGNPAHFICTDEEYIKKNQDYLVNLDGMNKVDLIQMVNNHPEILKKR